MTRRYLILGMGPAGISAAETIRAQDADGDILLLSEEHHGYYSRPGLAYYLTGELDERGLHPFRDRDYHRLDLRRLHARATALDTQAHQLVTDRQGALTYDRLLIATGSLAVSPALPGSDLDGVLKLDDLDDARHILKRCRRARAAVVLGGGITALELVEGLNARRVRPHYFLRRDRYWRNVLDESESRIVERRLQEEGVQIHYHTEAAEILGRRGGVAGVLTRDGQQLACDLVAIAIGVRPRMDLAVAAGLATERGILVDEYLRTSDPDVFAAGDVAQVTDPFSGKSALDTLWGSAVAQGRAAGSNMAGQSIAYRKSVPLNVTRLAGLSTTIIGSVGRGRDADVRGIVRGDSETWRQRPESVAAVEASDGNHVRLVVGERTLLGAVIMGDQSISRPLHDLIGGQVDIGPVRPQLLQPGAHLADVVTRFWIGGVERAGGRGERATP
jgi:NAD(P)H-nitrite reductase large subunit